MKQRNLNLYALLRPNPSTQEASWIMITKLCYCLAGKQFVPFLLSEGRFEVHLFFSSYRAKYRPIFYVTTFDQLHLKYLLVP